MSACVIKAGSLPHRHGSWTCCCILFYARYPIVAALHVLSRVRCFPISSSLCLERFQKDFNLFLSPFFILDENVYLEVSIVSLWLYLALYTYVAIRVEMLDSEAKRANFSLDFLFDTAYTWKENFLLHTSNMLRKMLICHALHVARFTYSYAFV